MNIWNMVQKDMVIQHLVYYTHIYHILFLQSFLWI